MRNVIEYFKRVLKQKKLRLTKQRKLILKMFLGREGHICVDELYYALHKKYPKLGRATVYRTMKLLRNIDIAAEINFSGKRRRFEHAFAHPHHDHFVCEGCGKIIEFVDPEIERKQELLCRKYRFVGERHLLQIFGLCPKCQ